MRKKRILIFGATGMAGHVAYHYLNSTEKYEIFNSVFREKLTKDSFITDVTDRKAVYKLINTVEPDFIINCVGILVKGSKNYPDNAILLNAYFPHLLKRYADETGAKLVHISTDCVFSGDKGDYQEDDFRDADDVYGRSKALGEIINDKDLTIRTSIVGPEIKKNGEGLFHWFMKQHGTINGYTNAYWGGITTIELAKVIELSIDNGLTGLVHATNGEKISKYDLLLLFKKYWNKSNIELVKYEDIKQDKSLKASKRFNLNVPSYPDMLREMAEWMNHYADLYVQYKMN